MKLEQRVAATTVSMYPCGMALMTRVSTEIFSLLTGPLLSLLELTSSAWYCLLLGQVSFRMNGLQKDHEPPPPSSLLLETIQHIMCMCIFLGKGSLAFIHHSKGPGTPPEVQNQWFVSLGCLFPRLYALSTPFFLLFPVSPSPWGARYPSLALSQVTSTFSSRLSTRWWTSTNPHALFFR